MSSATSARGTTAPTSTCRVQLGRECTLGSIAALVDSFDRPGVGALYLSPCLKSRSGSPHGYDIVDHNEVDPELGGEPAFGELARARSAQAMGLVLDFVPNHMAAAAKANRWWFEVLENGRRGELGLEYVDGRLLLRCFDHRLPISPRTAPSVLRRGPAHFAGEGQGSRGHGVLPPRRAGLAQRGGRRPHAHRPHGGRVPRRRRASARRLAARHAHDEHHETRLGEDTRASDS
jgi:maltooligosyltrehalose synthase